jgi:hypothetical protein
MEIFGTPSRAIGTDLLDVYNMVAAIESYADVVFITEPMI